MHSEHTIHLLKVTLESSSRATKDIVQLLSKGDLYSVANP